MYEIYLFINIYFKLLIILSKMLPFSTVYQLLMELKPCRAYQFRCDIDI